MGKKVNNNSMWGNLTLEQKKELFNIYTKNGFSDIDNIISDFNKNHKINEKFKELLPTITNKDTIITSIPYRKGGPLNKNKEAKEVAEGKSYDNYSWDDFLKDLNLDVRKETWKEQNFDGYSDEDLRYLYDKLGDAGWDPAVVSYAIRSESGYNPYVQNENGSSAIGLGQFTKGTIYDFLGKDVDTIYQSYLDKSRDVKTIIDETINYYKYLHDRLKTEPDNMGYGRLKVNLFAKNASLDATLPDNTYEKSLTQEQKKYIKKGTDTYRTLAKYYDDEYNKYRGVPTNKKEDGGTIDTTDYNKLSAISKAYNFVLQEENNKFNIFGSGYNPINKKWYPHKSFEGGTPTVGYGTKLGTGSKWAKIAELQGFLTNEQAEKAAYDQVVEHYNNARDSVNKAYGDGTFDALDPTIQFLLSDFDYTGTGIEKFPKFFNAAVKGDVKKMLEQYKRYSKGKPLGRNKEVEKILLQFKERAERKKRVENMESPISDFSVKLNYKDNNPDAPVFRRGGHLKPLTNNYKLNGSNANYITNNYSVANNKVTSDNKLSYTENYEFPLSDYSTSVGYDDFFTYFSDYLASNVENSKNSERGGWHSGTKTWTPHPSSEGGEPTIGFGLKMYDGTPQQILYKKQGFLTEKQEETIRKEITFAKYKDARNAFNNINNDADAFDKLSDEAKVFVTDYQYQTNSGVQGFPKLMSALYRGDYDTAFNEYHVFYKKDTGEKDKDGNIIYETLPDYHRDKIHRYFLERFKNGSYKFFK